MFQGVFPVPTPPGQSESSATANDSEICYSPSTSACHNAEAPATMKTRSRPNSPNGKSSGSFAGGHRAGPSSPPHTLASRKRRSRDETPSVSDAETSESTRKSLRALTGAGSVATSTRAKKQKLNVQNP